MTWTVENPVRQSRRDTWASAYTGLKVLTAYAAVELSISHVLDEPAGPAPQDKTRIWFRAGFRY
jgi:hypothetical protein